MTICRKNNLMMINFVHVLQFRFF